LTTTVIVLVLELVLVLVLVALDLQQPPANVAFSRTLRSTFCISFSS
jgi:hypothetical protein